VTVGSRPFTSRWDVPADVATGHAVARLGVGDAAASAATAADSRAVRACPSLGLMPSSRLGGTGGSIASPASAGEAMLGPVHTRQSTPAVDAGAGGSGGGGAGGNLTDLRVGRGVYQAEELQLASTILDLLAAGPGVPVAPASRRT